MKAPTQPREIVTALNVMANAFEHEGIDMDDGGLLFSAATIIAQLLDARDRVIVERDQARRNVRQLSTERDTLESTLFVLRRHHMELLETYMHSVVTKPLSLGESLQELQRGYQVEETPGTAVDLPLTRPTFETIERDASEYDDVVPETPNPNHNEIPVALRGGVSKLVEDVSVPPQPFPTVGTHPDADEANALDPRKVEMDEGEGTHPDADEAEPPPPDDCLNLAEEIVAGEVYDGALDAAARHTKKKKKLTPKEREARTAARRKRHLPISTDQPPVRDGGVVDGGVPGPQNPPKPERQNEMG